MDENETIEDLKRRVGLLEAAVFAEPPGDLPPERFVEPKKTKKKSLKPEKVKGYIATNTVSKTELVEIAKQLDIKTSRVLSRGDLIDIILGGEHTQEDPLQVIRDTTERFIQENNVAFSTMKCDLKCQQCAEPRVLLCHYYNKKTVQSYFEQQ